MRLKKYVVFLTIGIILLFPSLGGTADYTFIYPEMVNATGINNYGAVLGWGSRGAFLWKEDIGIFRRLGAPDGYSSFRPAAFNDSGTVVGWGMDMSSSDQTITFAFLWKDGEGFSEINPPMWSESYAFGVNSAGSVVGWAIRPDETATADVSTVQGFLWDTENGFVELKPSGWLTSAAHGINDMGIVVGDGYKGTARHVFLWKLGAFTDLGMLEGGKLTEFLYINNMGLVVGTAKIESVGQNHAFLWRDGVFTDLGVPKGWVSSVVTGINDAGIVVGYGSTGKVNSNGVDEHAFVWTAKGGFVDLNPPGWAQSKAAAINNSGIIVGYGKNSKEYKRAFIAVPKPPIPQRFPPYCLF